MTVLIPRIRTLGVRLSEDEYSSLERFCVEHGARSLSDMARTAICSFMQRGDQESKLASSMNQNLARVQELEEQMQKLSRELACLRAERRGEGEMSGNMAEPELPLANGKDLSLLNRS